MGSPISRYLQTHYYDVYGRLIGKAETVDKEDGQSYDSPAMFAETFHFDQYNRALRHYDMAGHGFGTQNVYNSFGLLEKVKEINTSQVYYRVRDLNARGQVIEDQIGGASRARTFNAASGLLEQINTTSVFGFVLAQRLTYTHDNLGNITQRLDQGQNPDGTQRNQKDVFAYDNLNRLTSTTTTANGTTKVQSQSYDWTGNILSKSNLLAGTSYQYNTARPHAVAQIGAPGTTCSAKNYHHTFPQINIIRYRIKNNLIPKFPSNDIFG